MKRKRKQETVADRIISMTPDEIQQHLEEHMDSIARARCHCSLELKERRKKDGRDEAY